MPEFDRGGDVNTKFEVRISGTGFAEGEEVFITLRYSVFGVLRPNAVFVGCGAVDLGDELEVWGEFVGASGVPG